MVQPKPLVKTISLATLTTLGVGGPAELWEVNTEQDLRLATREPFRVIGAGSNLLVADAGISERVIKLGPAFNDLRVYQGETDVWLGAATPLPGLLRRAANAGLSGLEGLLGIPAVLGGAITMNAGTRFGSMADSLLGLELFVNGRLERVSADSLHFGYRHSDLPTGAIVTRARLKLSRSSPERVTELMRQVDAARKTQPKVKSAGCAFKNPPGESAGRLIDLSGLKGLRVGQAMISLEHGNFIVNLGGAKAADVVELIKQVKQRVEVPLELEWRLWGFEQEVL